MRRVLITGSEGFVGQYITKKFLDEGWLVLGIDNLSKYNSNKVRPHSNYTLSELDLTQLRLLDYQWIRDWNPEVVVDLAEDVGGINYLNQNALSKLNSSLQIRYNMLTAMPKMARYVCISSSAVYERVNTFPTPELRLEDLPIPVSPYALSKINAEYMTEFSQVPTVVARLFNVAGKGDDHSTKSHVIADLVRKFKNCDGKPVILVGDGRQVRNFTHGEDVADALYLLSTVASPNGVYNIGSYNNISIWDLAVKIAERVKINSGLGTSDNPNFNITHSVPNISWLRDLGYEPKWDLDRILDEAVEYYV